MIKTLFDRLDSWRHLPNYQLERRADVFFSLYLQHVLQSRLGFEISPVIIPEFPVRIGTIYPHIDIDKSYKVDYACFSADKKTVVFVELKTEGQSRRKSQDKYLLASCAIDFSALIEGVIKIFQATQSKHKYFYLLSELAHAGFLTIPAEMCEAIQNDRLLDIRVIVDNIRILKCPQKSKIIYIQPNGEGPDTISFEEFKAAVDTYDDPVSKRFGQSLEEWSTVKAGHK